jgi:hypothetical protein
MHSASFDQSNVGSTSKRCGSREALKCLTIAYTTLGQTFGVEPEPDVATLEREFHYAWNDQPQAREPEQPVQ